VLPYANDKCDVFSTKLKKIVTKTFTDVNLRVAFKAPNDIGKHLPFKDKVEDRFKKSFVIYKITCSCGATYIGKTHRHLGTRIYEHKNNPASAVHKHLVDNPTHFVIWDNTEIVDTADSKLKLLIKEKLHILNSKPVLNSQLSQNDYQIKTFIVADY
jgi:predicted GIY-YIG superfamily endonuclease